MASVQLPLFASPARKEIDFTALRTLAERIPKRVRFGTSSWTFPGWSGLVYPEGTTKRELEETGLSLYAKCPLFRTVGIDRSYYRPLERSDLARYAAQLPDDFSCVMKVWSDITSRVHAGTREPNPRFLDAALFEDAVLGPVREAFASHAGPFVFEFAPVRPEELPRRGEFPETLARFFERLPRGPRYAVELRNRELFTPAYLKVLNHFGASHVLNFWERMPTIGEQLAVPSVLTANFVVARLLIPPGARYSDKKEAFYPFDRIVEPQLGLHEDVARLVEAALVRESDVFVIANNKAEGSSPLTIEAIAKRVARGP